MTAGLEKALREIQQLRRENAELRKRLGMVVSEGTADYVRSAATRIDETPHL